MWQQHWEKTVLVARIVSQDATWRINSEDYSILGFGAVLFGRSLSEFQKHPSSSWYEF
jgi:methenyltetrahydromethanopterin cyclohydrolase